MIFEFCDKRKTKDPHEEGLEIEMKFCPKEYSPMAKICLLAVGRQATAALRWQCEPSALALLEQGSPL